MSLTNISKVGVIGAGSFGSAIANLLAENNEVLLYMRNPKTLEKIKQSRQIKGIDLHPNVKPLLDIEHFCGTCSLIFPIVDSKNFRSMCQSFAPYLKPHHILIHGTKGLSVEWPEEATEQLLLSRKNIHTMTEVIRQETIVLRVGCLSGPNLAKELSAGKPAGTVIASRFDEVILAGSKAIRNPRFRVYGSQDVIGVELGGVLKNVLAIASGIAEGMDMGQNARALLITRGLGEMIHLGSALGSETNAFYGMAGIGDLIATCSSKTSRNFTVGYRLAQGQELDFILEDMNDTVEGIKTAKIAYALCQNYNIKAPIMEAVYKIIYENANIREKLQKLMVHSSDSDADYLFQFKRQ